MSYTLAYTGAEIDALLGKIDAIFVAEYGSTIYSEVTAAIAAGNKVIVANAGKVYAYAGQDDNSGYVFTQSGPNAAKPNATYVTLSTGNVWSTATVDLATLQQFYASLMEDTASGAIASFPDGAENVPVKELTADIEPIQDLHGQASPWPDGGNYNKLDPSSVNSRSNTTVNNGVVTQNNADSATPVFKVQAATQDLIPITPYQTSTVSATGVREVAFTKGANAYYVVFGLNGSQRDTTVYADIHDLADGIYYVQVNFTNITQGSVSWKDMMLCDSASQPFVPYSNICPISGYTGAEIARCGKNLWDGTYVTSAMTTEYSSWASGRMPGKFEQRVVPGKTYTFSVNGTAHGMRYWLFDKNYELLTPSGTNATSVTIPSGAAYLRWRWLEDTPQTTFDPTTMNAMLEEGSTATAYEPYNGTTYNIDWTDEAGTVYGGYFVVNEDGSVDLTLTHTTSDIGDINWNYNSTYAFFNKNITNKLEGSADTYMLCSCYRYGGRKSDSGMGTVADNSVCDISGSGTVKIKDTAYTDVAAFKAAKAGQKIYFFLAEPQTYHLDSIGQITTLLGDNNILANTGDISVKYRANTALYIEKKLGE